MKILETRLVDKITYKKERNEATAYNERLSDLVPSALRPSPA